MKKIIIICFSFLLFSSGVLAKDFTPPTHVLSIEDQNLVKKISVKVTAILASESHEKQIKILESMLSNNERIYDKARREYALIYNLGSWQRSRIMFEKLHEENKKNPCLMVNQINLTDYQGNTFANKQEEEKGIDWGLKIVGSNISYEVTDIEIVHNKKKGRSVDSFTKNNFEYTISKNLENRDLGKNSYDINYYKNDVLLCQQSLLIENVVEKPSSMLIDEDQIDLTIQKITVPQKYTRGKHAIDFDVEIKNIGNKTLRGDAISNVGGIECSINEEKLPQRGINERLAEGESINVGVTGIVSLKDYNTINCKVVVFYDKEIKSKANNNDFTTTFSTTPNGTKPGILLPDYSIDHLSYDDGILKTEVSNKGASSYLSTSVKCLGDKQEYTIIALRLPNGIKSGDKKSGEQKTDLKNNEQLTCTLDVDYRKKPDVDQSNNTKTISLPVAIKEEPNSLDFVYE